MRLGNIELDNPFIQAPLAGITDPPFRTIARRFHKGLIFSEMISAEALCRGNKRTENYFKIDEAHHPIALQLVGPDPDRLAQAARILENLGPDIIDINSGCPEHKIIKDGAGGALLKDPAKLVTVARKVVKAVKIPVSIKLRLGYEVDRSMELLEALMDTGISFITFNGYTVQQRWSGSSDWGALRRLALAAKDHGLPFIANGGASDEEKAVEMLRATGATAVMIGRATRGRPDLPGTAFSLLQTGAYHRMDHDELARTIHDHALLEAELYGEDKGIRRMRKNLMWYLKAARIRTFNVEVNRLRTLKELDLFLGKAINRT